MLTHLMREIRDDSVRYWCGRVVKTPAGRVPGPPDTGDLGMSQLKAWRAGGRKVCTSCADKLTANFVERSKGATA